MKRFRFTTHTLKKIPTIVLILSVMLGFASDTTEANAPEELGLTSTVTDPVLTPDLESKLSELEKKVVELSYDSEEILWFARAIRSETTRADEQRLVAWVIRNRKDIGHRGTTYKQVVLAPSQFSGLNSFDHNYSKNISRNFGTTEAAWLTALEIAREVYYAPDSARPISRSVTHFYSPNVVRAPAWTYSANKVHETTGGGGYVRFAFYSDVR